MKVIFVLSLCAPLLMANELSLQNAQELLFKHNYDLQSTVKDIEKASAEISEAKSMFIPTLDLSFGFNYTSEAASANIMGNPVIIGQKDRTETGIDLSYPLFTGLSRYYTLKSRETNKSAREQNYKVIGNRYSYLLGLMYFRWDLAVKQLEFRKKSVEQMVLYTDQIRALNEGGVVITSKVLEAQAKLKSAQLDYMITKDQADSLKLELLGLIGISDSSFMPQSSSFSIDTIQMPKQISVSRPEIFAIEKNVEQLKYNKEIIFAQRYPTITGFAGYRAGNPGLNLGTNEWMDYFLVGAQVKWNIFDGMRNRAQRTQIDKQISMVSIDKAKRIDDWNRALDLWKMQLSRANERIAVSQASKEAAEALMVSLENSLKLGVVTDVDYESAVTNFVQAGLQMEQAKFSKRIALLNGLYASGRDINF